MPFPLSLAFVLTVFVAIFLVPGVWVLGARVLPIPPLRVLSAAVVVGTAAVTLTLSFVSRWLGLGWPAIALSAGLVAFLGCLRSDREGLVPGGPHPGEGKAALAALIVGAILYFSQTIVATPRGVYFPIESRDTVVRVEQVEQVNSFLRAGVPPKNTFAWVGEQPRMATHHLFYLSCAALSRATGRPATETLPFMIAVAGMGFLLAGFHLARAVGRSRIGWLFWGLLFCEGFKIVAPLWIRATRHRWTNVDYWLGTPHISAMERNLQWGPHHVFSTAVALVSIPFLARAGGPRWRAIPLLGLALAGSLVCSWFVGAVLAVTLATYLAWRLWRRDYAAAARLAVLGAFVGGLALPLAPDLLSSSGGGSFQLALRPVEHPWAGKVSPWLGENLVTRWVDVLAHFLLQLGMLPVLAALGMWRALSRGELERPGKLLALYGGVSLAVALFVRSPFETAASVGILPFRVALAVFGALWVGDFLGRHSAGSLARRGLVLALGVHFFTTPYAFLMDSVARFRLPATREDARKRLVERDLFARIDGKISQPSYRIQVFPVRRNQDNYGLSSHIPSYTMRVLPLFVSDGAIAYGFDRDAMARSFAGLCAVYGAPHEELLPILRGYDASRQSPVNPWDEYGRAVERCLDSATSPRAAALLRFAEDFGLDYLLIEPSESQLGPLLAKSNGLDVRGSSRWVKGICS